VDCCSKIKKNHSLCRQITFFIVLKLFAHTKIILIVFA
jgi:hypothetical protein